jgi:hypothetical protein
MILCWAASNSTAFRYGEFIQSTVPAEGAEMGYGLFQ